MQWCRPSPKINSGRTLIPSDVILKIVVIRSRSSGVKSVIFNPFSWTKKRRKIFRESRDGGFSHTFYKSVFLPLVQDSRIPFPGDRDGGFSHIFCKSVIFYPLFLDSKKNFERVGMENFHTILQVSNFTPLSWTKDKGIIRRTTGSRLPYGLRFWP